MSHGVSLSDRVRKEMNANNSFCVTNMTHCPCSQVKASFLGIQIWRNVSLHQNSVSWTIYGVVTMKVHDPDLLSAIFTLISCVSSDQTCFHLTLLLILLVITQSLTAHNFRTASLVFAYILVGFLSSTGLSSLVSYKYSLQYWVSVSRLALKYLKVVFSTWVCQDRFVVPAPRGCSTGPQRQKNLDIGGCVSHGRAGRPLRVGSSTPTGVFLRLCL